MQTVVLAPGVTGLHIISCKLQTGPNRLEIRGLDPITEAMTVDRLGAAIANSGLDEPIGTVVIDADIGRDPDGSAVDLAFVTAVLLTDSANAHLRRPGIAALGGLARDGSLVAAETRRVERLPRTPWIGRFSYPVDRIPQPGEDAALSIVEVTCLRDAWDALIWLDAYERAFGDYRAGSL
jgi:hypothetical protein